MAVASVLLLADSRLPSGGHAHSCGIEMAVTDGLVSTVDNLNLFLRGRLRTAASMLAGFAAAACLLADTDPDWTRWDRAFSARTPSAAQRAASRAQGAALLRTATHMWDHPALGGLRRLGRPHHSLVLGASTAAGLGAPSDAAALAVHHLTGGTCSAAIRLLGLDPLAVAAIQADLTTLAAAAADIGCQAAHRAVETSDPAELPATSAVLPELLAARHATAEVTLFAS
ncbi:MAG TPA: urease accessory UreF family protein [Pseudonocardiaceae bacterium]|nr:urease accessory UreF family protein [Pseudonocardiaceae bacterium]